MRIGHGYDVHRLTEGRELWLGGVKIAYELGLDGHSDADVLLHAVCDALLGALALGDIGRHFPDNDSVYKNISSVLLLQKCTALMRKRGYSLCNLDATIIAQAPKLSLHIAEMCEILAKVFECETDRINVKATTEEHLGFTGEGLGIAAHCVLILH